MTGIGILSALGRDKKGILKKMKAGETGISSIKSFESQAFISQIGAEVNDESIEHSIKSMKLQSYDRCAQLAIIATDDALVDSGIDFIDRKKKIGVTFGTCNGGINSLEEHGSIEGVQSEKLKQYPFYKQADNLATHFHVTGPVVTINTACAASGNAIGLARDLISEGKADVMIAGGADSMSPTVFAGFNALKALNKQPCSPYNTEYGLSLGEGAAFLILEPLDRAVERGAKIYAEVSGYGLSNDAYHETAPDPDGKGIELAVKAALRDAQVQCNEIEYINTHGTGTKANDSAEINGLVSVFNEHFPLIPFSSSKAYFGHNLGAAAAIEYATTLLALQEDLLPATVNFKEHREGCAKDNLITNQMKQGSPKYFLCNNSAFGGHNASIVSKNGKYVSSESELYVTREKKRVVITGMSMIRGNSVTTGSEEASVSSLKVEDASPFSLKQYNASLFQRRMNRLSQFSIGAADMAINDSKMNRSKIGGDQIGLVYGTSKGTLESAEKYLNSIFKNSIEQASAIYFPDMVLNSTAGKISKKLSLNGFSSSLSTGGNDGLMSLHYGYGSVANGIVPQCLVGAGDEKSDLSNMLDENEGVERSYPSIEGSTFLVLSDFEVAKTQNQPIYAEVIGVGASFSREPLADTESNAVTEALRKANLSLEDIDLILTDWHGRRDKKEHPIEFFRKHVNEERIICLNDLLGYGESISSLNHLYAAAKYLHSGAVPFLQLDEIAATRESNVECENKLALVYSVTPEGNESAAILSKVC